jgi:hypothetical protein
MLMSANALLRFGVKYERMLAIFHEADRRLAEPEWV